MDNTKKQPMSDEELAKISGGAHFIPINGDECPYCGDRFGLRIAGYVSRCPMNPNNPYYVGQ